MSDNPEVGEEAGLERPLTNEEKAFAQLSETFKLVQQSVSSLSRNMTSVQQQIAQHFQISLMKELQIFRKMEAQIRSGTISAETAQENLTSLNILRVDSMAEISVIMENALRTIKEAIMDTR